MKIHTKRTNSGHTLLIALFAAAILIVCLAAALRLAQFTHEITHRSKYWNEAIVLAEAACEIGLADLQHTAVDLNQMPNSKEFMHELLAADGSNVVGQLLIDIKLREYQYTGTNCWKYLQVYGTGRPKADYFSNTIARTICVDVLWDSAVDRSAFIITNWSENI